MYQQTLSVKAYTEDTHCETHLQCYLDTKRHKV